MFFQNKFSIFCPDVTNNMLRYLNFALSWYTVYFPVYLFFQRGVSFSSFPDSSLSDSFPECLSSFNGSFSRSFANWTSLAEMLSSFRFNLSVTSRILILIIKL